MKTLFASWFTGVWLFVFATTIYGQQQFIIEQSIQPAPLKTGDRFNYRLKITNLSGKKDYVWIEFPYAVRENIKSPAGCRISTYYTYECTIHEGTGTQEFQFTGNVKDKYDPRWKTYAIINVEYYVEPSFKAHPFALNIKRKYKTTSLFEETLKLAKQGDTNAQFDVGDLYSRGIEVEQDYSQAVYWWEKAALQEHAGAQTMLGFLYYSGDGVPKDIEKAKYWLRKAIENGESTAMELWGWLNLGELGPSQFAGSFKDGMYVAPNELFSAKYQLTGASGGEPCCEQTVGDMFDEQTGMGVVSLSNEYGAVNGVFYGPASAIKYETGDDKPQRLKKWFYAVVMERLLFNVPESTVLKEESRKFNRMDAWIAVVEIPGGGVITSYEIETVQAVGQDSVRGFVVFQRGDYIFALMNENNVLGFSGPPRVYDPDNWDDFLIELNAFYSTMKFK